MSKNNYQSKNNPRTKSNIKTSASTTSKPSGILILLPLIIILSVIPFIVRMKIYNTGLSDFPWFSSSDSQTDFFLYYKSIAFTVMSFILAIVLIWQYINQRFLQASSNSTNIFKEEGRYKFTIALFPLGAYALLALLSTIFSKYSSFGYQGIFEQFESIFVLMGYCLVVFYAFLFVNTEEDVRLLIKWLVISVILLCLLGLSQATGNDFYATTFGKKLIVPSEHWNIVEQLKFTFEANRVYLTLYNPNYVGLYTALISPILLVLLLFTKNRKLQVVYGISILGLLLCMIASSSRNGFVALCVSLVFILILFRKLFITHWKLSISAIGLVVIGFLMINAYMGNAFITRLQGMFTDTKTPEYTLSSILTNNDNVEITYNENTFYIQSTLMDENYITFNVNDANGTPIEISYDEVTGVYSLQDSRFTTITLKPVTFESIVGFNLTIDGVIWYFSNQTGDNTYYYYNAYGKFEKIINADSAVFTDYEKIGSGRGYIWSRTIPLLKNHVLLGSGADTFSIAYPQNDYVGRFHNGYISSIITKPHNMYLQMAVQTGVLSLIAFLAFYGMYFGSCLKLYIKNGFDSNMSQFGAAIFVGTIGYMVSGFFNDSTITVTPVFWALMGVALAVNYRVKSYKMI